MMATPEIITLASSPGMCRWKGELENISCCNSLQAVLSLGWFGVNPIS
jgi:hypothetical protein